MNYLIAPPKHETLTNPNNTDIQDIIVLSAPPLDHSAPPLDHSAPPLDQSAPPFEHSAPPIKNSSIFMLLV